MATASPFGERSARSAWSRPGRGSLRLRQLVTVLAAGAAVVLVAAGAGRVSGAEPTSLFSENLLRNGSFRAEGSGGVPDGWSLYGGGGRSEVHRIELDGQAGRAVLLADRDRHREIGLTQAVRAKPGSLYRATAHVCAVEGQAVQGAYLQLRFLPSGKLFQTDLAPSSSRRFTEVFVQGVAPPGTTHAQVYLYTHRDPTPQVLLRHASLLCGPPPPPPTPPSYRRLKDLHLSTPIVRDGQPAATIVAPGSGVYEQAARRIESAIKALTGATVPLVTDEAPEAAVPIARNLIVLGNRSTNRCISELYNRFYTLLDLRYPGRGGYVVRTLHNPFGNGFNVIFVGGSDTDGVQQAAEALVARLRKIGAKRRGDALRGELSVGWIADIQLGDGIRVPRDVRKLETWEASAGYGSVGYFGWNSISKHMAAYYMTGDEFHAREALRLAFPDAEAKRQIAEVDGERIENKDAPLSGPYHYTAHMMILFWDLIEESPVFSDEERLRVINAFAKQLEHRAPEGIYGRIHPPAAVGSRHGQWSAVSLYCLGRYFYRSYPSPLWWHAMECARLHFRPLHRHAWVRGESDNLFWYNTGIAPVFTYMLLTGDRVPLENGVVARLLRGQEALVSGRRPDWALRSASIGYLHKAAYLTGDGRWLEYRNRTGVDMTVFRLGQSFWPARLKPQSPDDLVGRWTIHRLPEPMWRARRSGLPLEESFQFGSFRSAHDASGDFILIDGYNGASRNPYHTFALLELRLNGYTLLAGYRNQLLTRSDGLVEPRIAMDAALERAEVVGQTAVATAEVPQAAYCRWRRTLAQRIGRYGVVLDEVVVRADAENMEVELLWETPTAGRVTADGHIEFKAPIETPEGRGARVGQIHAADLIETTRDGRLATMRWVGPVREGQRCVFFSLVGVEPDADERSLRCLRVGREAAVLRTPAPALAVAGSFQSVSAELAILSADHLFAQGLTRIASDAAGAGGPLITAGTPLAMDWDFPTGTLHVVSDQPAELRLAVTNPGALRLDGQAVTAAQPSDGRCRIDVPAGRHVITGAVPPDVVIRRLTRWLAELASEASRRREAELAARESARAADPLAGLPALEMAFAADVGEKVVDMTAVSNEGGDRIYAAAGKTVYVLSASGQITQQLPADGAIRVIRWWPEHGLLLAGCVDERVIAFDRSGQRRWVFTSEMDPAVYRAAKTYWFKSAPGHEGIHGLYTGVFLNGQSQAFVGSACTLEILDADGHLIRRLPQFWGKVSHFAIIDGPGGSLNLLAARKYNGTNTVAIINNRTLDPRPRGFHTVPPGATYVPGWSAMNRHHLFYEDLDGDGQREVVSEINGTWNRVTVWRADGRALYDASFGPGRRIPARNMRDLEIAELDGDGNKEILAATSGGLVVALDCRCRKLWARRLPSPPEVMKAVVPGGGGLPLIIVGCEDGSLVALQPQGRPIRTARVAGRPTCIDEVRPAGSSPLAVIGTETGRVCALRVGIHDNGGTR